jgi:hypothetical protein
MARRRQPAWDAEKERAEAPAPPRARRDGGQPPGTSLLEVLGSAAAEFRERAASGTVPPHLIAAAAAVYPLLGLYLIWEHPRWWPQQKLAWTAASAAVTAGGLLLLPRAAGALLVLSGYALAAGALLTHRRLSGIQKLNRLLAGAVVCLVAIVGLLRV